MNSTQAAKSTLDKIKLLVRTTSCSALEAMSQKSGVTVQDVPADQKILGHWMSLISISGDQLHITFKVQFSIMMARAYAESVLKTDTQEISNSHSKDFIREFCNLLAGNIKNKLAENNIVVGISLPLLCRGFDDLFFSEIGATGQGLDRWKLRHQNSEIFCISDTEVISSFNLDENFNTASTASGEVEFF